MIGLQNNSEAAKTLMITPYHQTQRGNSITAERIRSGLTARGYRIDLISLEDPSGMEMLGKAKVDPHYQLIHGFHAWHMGKVLKSYPFQDSMPIILTTTGTDIHYYLNNEQRTVVEFALRAAHRIILFNDSFRAGILEILPQLENKLTVIPQGVWLGQSSPRSRSDWGFTGDDIIFLLPSGLRPVKNIGLALDGLSRLHSDYPQIKLIIIGSVQDPEYGSVMLKQIEALPWITYFGEVPHQEIGAIMAIGDIVLNTSLSEGQPQAALEAMSLGLPAILTAVPGNLYLIQNGMEGFYVRDEDEFYRSARQLVEDEALRTYMGRNCQKLVSQRFNPEDEIIAYENIYNLFL